MTSGPEKTQCLERMLEFGQGVAVIPEKQP